MARHITGSITIMFWTFSQAQKEVSKGTVEKDGTYSAFQFLMYCLGAFHPLYSNRGTLTNTFNILNPYETVL